MVYAWYGVVLDVVSSDEDIVGSNQCVVYV